MTKCGDFFPAILSLRICGAWKLSQNLGTILKSWFNNLLIGGRDRVDAGVQSRDLSFQEVYRLVRERARERVVHASQSTLTEAPRRVSCAAWGNPEVVSWPS